jgi:hypothetical protein
VAVTCWITVSRPTPVLDPETHAEIGHADPGKRFEARRVRDHWVLAVDGRGRTGWMPRTHITPDDPAAFQRLPGLSPRDASGLLIALFVVGGFIGVYLAAMAGLAGYGTDPSPQDSKIVNSLGFSGLVLLAAAAMSGFGPRSLRMRTLGIGLGAAVAAALIILVFVD